MVTASFRFYEELNDFLAPARRQKSFECPCAQAATVKHMIEALGVPHTEVEIVLLNGESVGFDVPLAEGDRVAIYPKFEAFDVSSLLRVRATPLRAIRFLADAHLGGLARLLRMTGFDTLYDNNYHDTEIAQIALREGRTVLTRDRDLLKRRDITHGCYVRLLKPRQQLAALVDRLDLAGSVRPFSRCLHCNAPLRLVDVATDRDLLDRRVPPAVRAAHTRYQTCDACGKVFWRGSHWARMRALLEELALPSGP